MKHNSTFRNILRRQGALAATAAAAAMMAGCVSDGLFRDAPAEDGQLRFSVAMQESHYATRSCGTLTLGGDDSEQTLYLLATETDGIAENGNTARTRGAAVTTGSFHDAIGVSAYMGRQPWDDDASQTGFMYNEEVTAASQWTTSYRWPGQQFTMRFFAYAPYAADGLTLSGIDHTGRPEMTYTVATDAEQQTDLVTADTGDIAARSATPELRFSHRLTAVRFVSDVIQNGGEIISLALKNIYATADSPWGMEWSGHRDITNFTLDTQFNTKDAFGQTINEGTSTFLMMPQTLPDDAEIEVRYKDRNGLTHTLTAAAGGIVWNAGTTVTYRISYSNIAIEPPLRNVATGERFLSGATAHDLKLDFANSTFDEMEVRVIRRLLTTNLSATDPAAYAAQKGIATLPDDIGGYGEIIVNPVSLTAEGGQTTVDVPLMANEDENMIWQILVQYRLPLDNGTGNYTDWTDAGTELYQDAVPCDGQDWIFYYDDSYAWTTPYHEKVIYKSTQLMKEPQTEAVEIAGIKDWWQCDPATSTELQQNIAAIQQAFQTANRSGAISIPDKTIPDVHYVTGTYGGKANMHYVSGESVAVNYDNNWYAPQRGTISIGVTTVFKMNVSNFLITDNFPSISVRATGEPHPGYSTYHMLVLPKYTTLEDSETDFIDYKNYLNNKLFEEYVNPETGIANVSNVICCWTNKSAEDAIWLFCICAPYATVGTNNVIYDYRYGWSYWNQPATARVISGDFIVPFDPSITDEDIYTLSVDEEDSNVWVRKPYSAVTTSNLLPQQ